MTNHTPLTHATPTTVAAKTASGNKASDQAKVPHNTFGWAATLFGTAVGAGILFLPLSAGAFGFWPLLIATLLIGPITYLSHLAYVRIIARSPKPGANLLEALSAYFGRTAGTVLSAAYLIMLLPVLLVYAVSITNTVSSFITNQLGGPELPRAVVAVACVGLLTLALATGEKVMLTVAQATVIPLLIALGAFSLYLVPRWDVSSFLAVRSETSFLGSLILILPVLVFSFTFIGSVSQFSVSVTRSFGPRADAQFRKVILLTTALLTVFTMFFVWSCALALGADGMQHAAEENLPVLSYFANTTDTAWLALATPIISMCAIASSYIGVALGAREGLQFLAKQVSPRAGANDRVTYLILFVIATLVAIADPTIMDLITVAGGLLITVFQFGVPMLCIYTVASLRPLRNHAANAVVIIFGLIVLGTTVWGFF